MKAQKDRATDYARDVVAGKVVVGRPVRLACERHLRDMKRKDLKWRPEMSERIINFFSDVLVLEDQDEDGNPKPFVLEPFQCFIYGSLFGWYGLDGYRRFHDAYIETGKGSGKTPGAAGVGLYGLVADGEPAPEVYSAATTQDQASICWRDAKRMVEDSADLRDLIEVQVAALSVPAQHAVFRPLSAEHRGLDGKRVHIGIIDELHEHPSNVVTTKIRKGMKRRRNALTLEITNSGHDKTSVCWEHHKYSLDVLEGVKKNDSWFAYVCALDLCEKCQPKGIKASGCTACDDWRDEKVWPKANPGLGRILTWEYLRNQVALAVGIPSEENITRRLNFCEWTEQFQRWLDMAAWDGCGKAKFSLDEIKGLRCFAGLDMASRSDFAAFVKLFGPDEDGVFYVVPRFWLPADSLEQGTSTRTEADLAMLKVWADAGLIETTSGATTDYDVIEAAILKDAAEFNIVKLAYDRFDVTQLVTHLRDALGDTRVIDFPQTMAAMSAPSKELESLVKDGNLRHGAHPVLRWMAANATIKYGPNEMIKPDKEKSADKIDGIIGLVMALAKATETTGEAKPSVYEERGLLMF